jgi:transcription termination/antitermination protein NusA
MDTKTLVESFSEFKEFKNIDRVTMMSILEDVFKSMLAKKYGTDENIDVIINVDKGDLEIWRTREIIADDELEDEMLQIPLSEALKIEPDFEVGEDVTEEIKFEGFGRRAILSIRQNLASRLLDLEKDAVYRKYKDRVGDMVTGEEIQLEQ